MIIRILPLIALIFAASAHAGFKPACKDKDKDAKHAPKPPPLPPGPPTAEQAEKVNQLLAQDNLKYKKMNKEFRKLMGKPGRQLLRNYVKEMRGQHKKVTRAQRLEFMRTALQNWINPPNNAANGVTYDQYVNNNGTVIVIPPGGQDFAANPPPANAAPPAGQGTAVVVIPPNGIQ